MERIDKAIRESVTEPWVRLEKASMNNWGDEILTFVIKMPKFMVAQFNTHSMVRRNSASTRAIPTKKQTERIREDIFVPPVLTLNQKGMAGSELLGPELYDSATKELIDYYHEVHEPFFTKWAEKYNIHKQHSGRYSESFMWTEVCVTGNYEWFWDIVRQRDNLHAQPEFQIIGDQLKKILKGKINHAQTDWHTPFLTPEEENLLAKADKYHTFTYSEGTESYWLAVSAARCARVSYLNHYGKRDTASDVELFLKLIRDGHMSPLEHVVRQIVPREKDIYFKAGKGLFCGPYCGFRSLRSIIEVGE